MKRAACLAIPVGCLAGVFLARAFAGVPLLSFWCAAAALAAGACLGLCALRMGRALPCVAFLIPAFFLPDYCVGNGPSIPVSIFILLVTLLCFAALRFTLCSSRAPAFESGISRVSGALILAATVLYIAASIGYCLLRYVNFAYATTDLGVIIQSFWTTTQGRLFWNTHELYPGGSHFGKHCSPFWFLIVPFYVLRPHASTLFSVTATSIGLFGAAVYLYARERLGRYGALCLGLSAMLYPGMVYPAEGAYFDMHHAPLMLILALIFYQKKRLGPFCVFLLLACGVREDIPLTTFMFGVLALLQRRTPSWVLLPMAISVCWFAVAVYIVIPSFGTGTMWQFYSGLGDDPISAARQILSSPHLIAGRFAAWDYIKFVYLIFMPLAVVIPLMGIEVLGALPTLAILAFSSMEQTRSIYCYYYMPCIPFVFAAAVSGIGRLASLPRLSDADAHAARIALCIFVFSLSLAAFVRGPLTEILSNGIPRPYRSAAGTDYKETFRELIERVPPRASVFAPRYLTPYLAHRMFITSVNPTGVEYIVLDSRTGDARTAHWQRNPLLQRLEQNRGFVKIFDKDGVKLFRRAVPMPPKP